MSTRRSREKQKPIVEIIENEEESEEVVMLRKIKAPIKWSNLPKGFIIQDLLEVHFEEALTLIKDHYLNTDVMCLKSDLLLDPVSVDDIMKRCVTLLNDKCSIVALDEATNEVAGVLILRIMQESERGKVFSRVRLTDGVAYKKIRNVTAFLNRKNNCFTIFNVDSFLRFYHIAVHPKYRKKGVGLSLMRSAVDVARSLDTTIILGIFANATLQNKAKRVGMQIVKEVFYVDWVENNEMVFDDPGPGNYTIALMVGQIPPAPIPVQVIPK